MICHVCPDAQTQHSTDADAQFSLTNQMLVDISDRDEELRSLRKQVAEMQKQYIKLEETYQNKIKTCDEFVHQSWSASDEVYKNSERVQIGYWSGASILARALGDSLSGLIATMDRFRNSPELQRAIHNTRERLKNRAYFWYTGATSLCTTGQNPDEPKPAKRQCPNTNDARFTRIGGQKHTLRTQLKEKTWIPSEDVLLDLFDTTSIQDAYFVAQNMLKWMTDNGKRDVDGVDRSLMDDLIATLRRYYRLYEKYYHWTDSDIQRIFGTKDDKRILDMINQLLQKAETNNVLLVHNEGFFERNLGMIRQTLEERRIDFQTLLDNWDNINRWFPHELRRICETIRRRRGTVTRQDAIEHVKRMQGILFDKNSLNITGVDPATRTELLDRIFPRLLKEILVDPFDVQKK